MSDSIEKIVAEMRAKAKWLGKSSPSGSAMDHWADRLQAIASLRQVPEDAAPSEQVMTLTERIGFLEMECGSLRRVGEITGVDPAYLSRLKSGEKDAPSEETLRKLGLVRRVGYAIATKTSKQKSVRVGFSSQGEPMFANVPDNPAPPTSASDHGINAAVASGGIHKTFYPPKSDGKTADRLTSKQQDALDRLKPEATPAPTTVGDESPTVTAGGVVEVHPANAIRYAAMQGNVQKATTAQAGAELPEYIDPNSRNFKEGLAVGMSCEQRLADLIRNPVCDRCGARNAEEASKVCSPDGDSCPGAEFPLTNLWGDA